MAVLGLGRMGQAIVGRLLEGGHRVAVWNRTKGKAGEVVSAGAREAGTVAQAVSGADVVITLLANDDALRAVALGELRPPWPRRSQSGRSGGLSDDQLRDLLANNPLLPNGLRNRFEGILAGSQDGSPTSPP